MILQQLENFRDLKITKAELEKTSGYKPFGNYEISLSELDLIRILDAYIRKQIDQIKLIEWVNFIWFSDWYDHSLAREKLASIMYELEELDERDEPLSIEEAQSYIKILNSKNATA